MNLKAFLFLKNFLLCLLKNEKALAICAASIAIWSLDSVYSRTNSERLIEIATQMQHSRDGETYTQGNYQCRSQIQDNALNFRNSTELACTNRPNAIKNKGHTDKNFVVVGFLFLPFLLHVPDLVT
ncbi:hypothetical protein ACO0KY_12040 [Undibacterium sp. Dicai25W]|uniref:hypothetical protein n=1 Tax=Undibacterium sp. Dicai25W TaxID=3413034 RepID=UPI003BF3CEDC